MEALLDILATPTRSFQHISVEPVWRTAVSLITAAFFLLIWLGGCWTNLSQAFQWTSLIGPSLISPLIVVIVSIASTAFIYLVNAIMFEAGTRPTSFKALFSVNIHCGAIFLLGEFVNFLLVRTNLLGDHPTPLRGRFPVGLDLLLVGADKPNLYLAIVLHSTSIFIIWYLAVLALGIKIVTKTSTRKVTAIVFSLWCAAVTLALGAAYAAGGGTTIRIRL